MAFIVNEQVEEYAAEHTTQLGELFDRLAAETREKTTAPQMMVGRIEGGFLAALVRLTGAKRILELGTFTGYSSISMASALAVRRPDRHVRRRPGGDRDRAPLHGRERARRQDRDQARARRWRRSRRSRARSTSSSSTRTSRTTTRTTRPCCRSWPTTAWSSPTTCSGPGGSSSPTATSRRRRSRHSTSTSRSDDRVVSVMLTVRDGMTLVQLRSGALLK